MARTVVLVILDGWGIGERDESNPVYSATPHGIMTIEAYFPSGALQASGIAVGLPWDEVGNSEVGHLTLGAGKILYQHLPRISRAIDDESFFKNPALINAFTHAATHQSTVHCVGLLTSGSVHASLHHCEALIMMAKKMSCKNFFLHIITDGKDSLPRSAPLLLEKLSKMCKEHDVGTVVSIMGRYYAMDRDAHWDRTERAYHTLIGTGISLQTPEAAIEKARAKNLDDEFIEPHIIGEPHGIQNHDAVIFFNFREDSMRQITEPFLNPEFSFFDMHHFSNLYVATMTEYDERFHAHVAFPREYIVNPLGKVLADNHKNQLRIAETEKYAHVTYFFNGLEETPFPNEYRVLIPSQASPHPDEHPEMMASAITDRAIAALREGAFDFILINYANPDIIAHTGNYDATLAAISIVDHEIERLTKVILDSNHVLLVTGDHGNAESVLNTKSGEVETSHDPSPVPFYLVGNEFMRKKPNTAWRRLPIIGILSDVAPTILALMNIPKPPDMTGQNLLEQLL